MAEYRFTDSVRGRDGAAAGLPGARIFLARCWPGARRRTLDQTRHTLPPRRKLLRSLTRAESGAIRRICFRTHVCVKDGRFARREQASGASGRGRRMERRDRLAPGKAGPERNPAERPESDVLARRANRAAGCDAAVRPHGRMRDRPKDDAPLRHAKPSGGGRKALSARPMCRRADSLRARGPSDPACADGCR